MKTTTSIGLRLLLSCITISFFSTVSVAQAPVIEWDKTFGGVRHDFLDVVIHTSDKGNLLFGTSNSGLTGNKTLAKDGLWLIKTDSSGNRLWEKAFAGQAGLVYAEQTSDGGYICSMASRSGINADKSQANFGESDTWVLKLDSLGNKQWDKSFGGTKQELISAITQTNDRGYLLVCRSESGINGNKTVPNRGRLDYWVIKLDSVGNKQWEKVYGGSGDESPTSVLEIPGNNYIIGGYSNSGANGDKSEPSRGEEDFWILKLDSLGNKIWDKTFGGNGYDNCSGVIKTNNSDLILYGHTSSDLSGDKSHNLIFPNTSDAWLVKIDLNGNKIWDKSYGGDGQDAFYNAISTSGGYIFAGSSSSGISGHKSEANRGYSDVWVVGVDTAGSKIWDKTAGGNNSDIALSINKTYDNGYVVAARSTSDSTFDKSEPRFGLSIYIDYWVVKLGPATLTSVPSIIKPSLIETQVYPNPFCSNTTIFFELKKPELVDVKIYNNLGQQVAQYKKHFDAGEQQLQWKDLKGTEKLSSGTYYYLLSCNSFQESSKLILIR